jgi:hypothetical protein
MAAPAVANLFFGVMADCIPRRDGTLTFRRFHGE